MAFVSHEGQYDNAWAVYLCDALEKRDLRTSVDQRELTVSFKLADELSEKKSGRM